MPLPINPKKDRAWLRYAREHAESAPAKRKPTQAQQRGDALRRLLRAGWVRRVTDDGVWFENAAGRRTPVCAGLDEAIREALRLLD